MNTLERVAAEEAEAEAALEAMRTGKAPVGIPQSAPPETPPAPAAAESQAPAPAAEITPPASQQTEPDAVEPDKDKIIAALQKALEKEKNDNRALRIKMEKEGPRYAAEIKALKEEVATLKTQQASANQPASGDKSSTNPKLKRLQEDLGIDDNAAGAMNDFIADSIASGVQATLERLGIKAGQAEETAQHTASAKPAQAASAQQQEQSPNLSDESWGVVRSFLPDYERVTGYNAQTGEFSPQYLSWLGEYDQRTGYTNGQLLESAVRQDDPNRFVAIVNEFKFAGTTGHSRQERPLSPNTGGRPGAGTKPKPTYSRKDADAFEKDYQNRVGSMSMEERQKADAIMAAYEQAALEGRVI